MPLFVGGWLGGCHGENVVSPGSSSLFQLWPIIASSCIFLFSSNVSFSGLQQMALVLQDLDFFKYEVIEWSALSSFPRFYVSFQVDLVSLTTLF